MAAIQLATHPTPVADQARAALTEDYFRAVVDSLATGLVVFRHDGHIECVNPAAQQILGVAADDLMHGGGAGIISDRMVDSSGRRIGADRWSMACRVRTSRRTIGRVVGVDRPDGKRVWLSTSWCLLDPADRMHSPMLVSFTDITNEHATSQWLAHQANHDALTGLPNRAHMLNKVSEALQESDENGVGAILFVDLDNLKVINDTLGHEAGDAALKLVADRLRSAVRLNDLVARLGGDEFVAVLCGSITSAEVDHISERLHALLSEPAIIGGTTLRLGASVGIAEVEPDDDRNADDLLRDADQAMYTAKKSGRGRTCRFAKTAQNAGTSAR